MSEVLYRGPARLTMNRRWSVLLTNVVPFALLVAEFGAIICAALASTITYHFIAYGVVGDLQITITFATLVFVLYFVLRLARKRYDALTLASQRKFLDFTARDWTLAFLAALSISFLMRETDVISRGAVIMFFVSGFISTAGVWLLSSYFVRAGFKQGWLAGRRTMVIGTADRINAVLTDERLPPCGLHVDESMVLALSEVDSVASWENMTELRKTMQTAVERIRKNPVDDVLLAIPWSNHHVLQACTEALMETPTSIYYLPESSLSRFARLEFRDIGGLNGLRVIAEPLGPLDVAIKRGFDIVVASLALIMFLPLFVIVAISIKLTSHGPVFFLQRRHGWNQKTFRIFKFRTMTVVEDGEDIVQAKPGDARITAIGGWLRRLNLDELPQLANVLMGHMSLVGPRPHALVHNRSFEKHISLYARRHNVLPGLTGWAQVCGLRGETDTNEKMRARVEHDLYYIDNWSIWFDIKILMLTVVSKQVHINAR